MTDFLALKRRAQSFWAVCDSANEETLLSDLQAYLSPDVQWQGFRPANDCTGIQNYMDAYVTPLRQGLRALERQTHILMAGASDGKADGSEDGAIWVGATGYLCARQVSEMWGLPSRHSNVRLRWGEFLEFNASGQITRIQCLIDVIDWLEQLGLSPLPRPKGAPFVYPAPTGVEGVLLTESDPKETVATLKFARDFIYGGLNAFDSQDLNSMAMDQFFHPNLKWYGPGGIGACLSFKEFQSFHQAPYLKAFPDRKVQDLDNLIADGPFIGASSLPGVKMSHTGPYLGHGATGNTLFVHGVDFWLLQNNQLTENWVFVDMIHLFEQMGIDLMQKVAHFDDHAFLAQA